MILTTMLDTALDNPGGGHWLALQLDRNSRDVAVMVVDLSGFSGLTSSRGIAAALMDVRRMQIAVEEATGAFGGRVVKFWADNALSVFPEVTEARNAACAISSVIPCAIGIGFGRTALIEHDAYGAEVNAACRLGEDTAATGEILMTERAKAHLT